MLILLRFVLASITFYKDQDVFTFELWAGDNLAYEPLCAAFSLVANSAPFFADRLKVDKINN